MTRRRIGLPFKYRLRDSTGANLVEAAIALPLVLLVTFALVEFATLFYVFLALENGVSQATRYAVIGNQLEGSSREESIEAAMRDATPTLTIADAEFSFSHLPAGGSEWVSGAGGPDDVAKVTVDHPLTFVSPLVRIFFTNGQIQLTVESTMKNEPLFE